MAKPVFTKKSQFARNAIREDLLQFALPALLIFAAGLLVAALHLIETQTLFLLSPSTILGLAFVIAGYTFAFVATATLRRYYSSTLVIRQDHHLVTNGIYHYCRHPIYLGVLLVATGLTLFANSLPGLLIMLALIPIFLNRIRIEERLLNEEFGDAYVTYCENTRKLIPYIY